MKEFIFPEFQKGVQVCGIYKMIFDDGSYYVGSSLNLRQRMWGWKFKLNNGVDKNYKVTAAFKNTFKVTFEIMEVVDDPIFRKFREDGYIKINIGKPLCLNIASSAYNNLGIKMRPNRKENKVWNKTIVKIDDYGNILDTYESIREANDMNGTTSVSDCFKDCNRKVKGMMYRELDGDGNIVSPPFLEKKPRTHMRKGYKLSEEAKQRIKDKLLLRKQSPDYVPPKLPTQTKPINQYNLDGTLYKSHPSLMSAARELQVDSKNFKRQIKKSPRNYYKGFIFKYA
jgi:group I intron endonuclease